MQPSELRRFREAIGRHLGQTLTPDVAADIEAATRAAPTPTLKRDEVFAEHLANREDAIAFNLHHEVTADTAYAEYIVGPADLPGQQDPRAFWVNKSTASLIDDSQPPNYTRYIKRLRQILLEELAFRGRDILVLGAGGGGIALLCRLEARGIGGKLLAHQ